MKNYRRIIWGVVFIIAAVLLALRSFGIIDFNLFFDGWWTLFIIIPSLSDMLASRFSLSSVVCFGIGVALLLACLDVISFSLLWKLVLPAILAIIGLKMILSTIGKSKRNRIYESIKKEGRELKNATAIFGGSEIRYDGEVFDGAELTAIFGGVECDLRGAVIDRDCIINASAIFGGVDIYVPDNVKVINRAVGVFGGVDVKRSNPNAPYTLYIEGIASFGGIDVK